MRVAQISDIHWRGIQRHEEYTRAFNLLFKQLRERDKPDIIVCTGDIFHTKTQGITPEVIDKLVWMFNGLADIAPLHIILGNHDGNLTNEDRQDMISPIVDAIGSNRIFLYKKSGIYPVEGSDINLCAFSCFDKDGWSSVHANTPGVNVALFHGSVMGCQTDNMWRLKEGEVTTEFFRDYDFAMLGDIHKRQYLGMRAHSGPTRDVRPWIGYPGSLIQQNYGEDTEKGYFLWDIRSKRDWNVSFVELPNLSPFVTVEWKGSARKTIEHIVGSYKQLSGVRLRISAEEAISPLEVRQVRHELVELRGAVEVVFKNSFSNKSTTVQTNSVQVHKASLRNDTKALCQLYREYVATTAAKHPLSEEQLTKAETVIVDYIERLKQQEQDSSARDIIWSIKGLEFDNLYRYGAGNKLDFDKMSGVVGIFGPNRVGKSSIVGSLMYGLYNTTDRGPIKSSYIINKNKNEAVCRVLISVGGVDYYIVRKVEKAQKRKGVFDEEKAATSLNLFRISGDGSMCDVAVNSENSESRTDTDKVIRKLIGTSQDFLLTAFSNQGGINRFIEEGATERKAILNRFLDLDIFEKLCKFANDDKNVINARTAKFSSVAWEVTVFQAQKKLEQKEVELQTLRNTVTSQRVQLEALTQWLKEHEQSNTDDLTQQINNYRNEIQYLNAQVEKQTIRESQLTKDIASAQLSVDKLNKDLLTISVEELNAKKLALLNLRTNFQSLGSRLNNERTKLEGQKKSIKKLSQVPCGNSFPSCHFIKDGHEDKLLVEDQAKLVESLLSSFELLQTELTSLEHEQIDQKLQENATKKERILSLNRQLSSFDRELALVAENKARVLETVSFKQTALTSAEQKLKQLNNAEFDTKSSKKKVLSQQLQRSETQLTQLLIEIGGDKAKIEGLLSEKTECTRLLSELKVYESIFQGFSKNGIPAMVLKTQLPAINNELEKILSGVTEFKLTLETEVNSNTLDVYVEDNHSRRVIELGSGMEKMIASLALRAALINLSSLPKPDTFIVDEGFGVLDEDGIQKCCQLLTMLKANFKTIIVISHIPQIKEIADRIIEITNNGTESRVEA